MKKHELLSIIKEVLVEETGTFSDVILDGRDEIEDVITGIEVFLDDHKLKNKMKNWKLVDSNFKALSNSIKALSKELDAYHSEK